MTNTRFPGRPVPANLSSLICHLSFVMQDLVDASTRHWQHSDNVAHVRFDDYLGLWNPDLRTARINRVATGISVTERLSVA